MTRLLVVLALLLPSSAAFGQTTIKGELSRTSQGGPNGGSVYGDFHGDTKVYGGGTLFGGGYQDHWIDIDLTPYTLATPPDILNVYPAQHRFGEPLLGSFSNTGAAATKPHLTTLNGRNAILFDGSDDYLYAAGGVGSWNFLHQGTTDFEVWIVFSTTDANPNALFSLMGSNAGSILKHGFWLLLDDRASVPRNEVVAVAMTNGGATPAFSNVPSGDDAWAAATVQVMRLVCKPGDAGDDLQVYVEGTQVLTADAGAAYSSNDSDHVLQLGAAGNNNFIFKGTLGGLYAFRRSLSTQDAETMLALLQDRWGSP